jgi:3-oxoadipate enol-lactonase
MSFAHVGDGVEFYYELHGDGPNLLFISGTGGDLRRRPGPQDAPFGNHFTVLAYDQRGLGRSSKPDRPYSMAEYADDAAALMTEIGWASARVIGASFGGIVAQELALRHPEKVERLALACTSPGGAGGASYPLHEFASLDPAEQARHMLALLDTRWGAAWEAADPARAEATRNLMLASARPIDTADPAAPMGARRQLEARAGHDTFDRLPNLKLPVGIFAGRYDGIALAPAQEAMHRQIPGSRLQLFEGGHLFMFQDPAAYPAIIEFLAG